MSLTAAVWPQFATQVFRRGIGRLTCIGSYVNNQVTTFTFRARATTCSKHHTRTVMDAGCECAPWVRSANPSDSWTLVNKWNCNGTADYSGTGFSGPLDCSLKQSEVPPAWSGKIKWRRRECRTAAHYAALRGIATFLQPLCNLSAMSVVQKNEHR